MNTGLQTIPAELQSMAHAVLAVRDLGVHKQMLFRFSNGYGASVVQGLYTYGGSDGLYELAVLRYRSEAIDDFDLTYSTPVTNDVLGWLDVAAVEDTLNRIKALPNPAAVTR